MTAHITPYKPLLMLALESVIAGAAFILFLHYALPFAEHPRILNTIGLLMNIVGVTWIAYDIFPLTGLQKYSDSQSVLMVAMTNKLVANCSTR